MFIVISCGDPDVIFNGTRTGQDFTYGSTVNYECNSGFKLIGVRSRTCQDSGNWSGEPPTCNGKHQARSQPSLRGGQQRVCEGP